MAELTFSFDYDSFFDSASYFGILLGFDSVSYVHRNRKKQYGFLVFFTFFDCMAYDRIFFLTVHLKGSDPHGHIPCLERQEKGISFEERL